MDADTIFLALRVIVALGVVLAVLWILRRRLSKGQSSGGRAKPGARTAGTRRAPLSFFGRAPQGATAAVRGRHALGQKSSVAVVEFDGREFLLGVTEHGVTVLHQAGQDEEELDDLVELPVAVVAPEPELLAPVAEPVAQTEQVAEAPVAEPAPDWAALFARELVAAQQAMAAEQAAAAVPQATPVAEPQPATPVAQPAAAHEPATVFAPRYARSGSPILDVEDEIDPASGLVPQPLPVRTVITGQFIAEVELMPLPTSAIPIVPAAAPVAPAPVPTPAPAAAAPAARPAWSSTMLPITAMIPTITIPARPAPAPVAAPATVPVPQPEPVAAAVPQERPASPLAGSILSPDTWRQTVDAFRQLR